MINRLQKILAEAGLGSRRAAEGFLKDGRVTVNGKVAVLGQKADPGKDRILFDGNPIRLRSQKTVYAFNKPKGVITTLSDPQSRSCLADYLKDMELRLFPVGRLDRDASGLLILTDDGELAQQLTHPRYHVPKTYLVEVRGRIDKKAVRRMSNGLLLGEKMTDPAEVTVLRRNPKRSRFLMTIGEGRNHQVKRMCRRVGLIVEELKRVAIGSYELRGLNPGEMKLLSWDDLKLLKKDRPLG